MTRIPVKTKSSKTKKESVLRAVTYEIKGVEFPYGQVFVNDAINNESRQQSRGGLKMQATGYS